MISFVYLFLNQSLLFSKNKKLLIWKKQKNILINLKPIFKIDPVIIFYHSFPTTKKKNNNKNMKENIWEKKIKVLVYSLAVFAISEKLIIFHFTY